MKLPGIILVTGATGQQGGATLRELRKAGHTVRAVTRKPESEAARSIAALGAEVVKGDLDDPAAFAPALAGVWGVFGLQNTWEAGVEREEAQGKSLIDLAHKAGVQHYVYASVGSADRKTGIPHFDNKWRVEENLHGAGFPSWTVLRPAFFMENLASPWFKPSIDLGKLVVALDPKTRLQMIAVADIGKYGRLAFERHAELKGRSIDIAGDEKTMPETAAIIGKAKGKPVTFERQAIEQVRQFSPDFACMLEWFDRVGYNAKIEANAKEFGIQPTKLEEWARAASWS